MKIFRLSFFLLLFLAGPLSGQLSVKNQLSYSYWNNQQYSLFNNWFDLSYRRSFFYTGIRFDINDPPDPNIFPVINKVNRYDLALRFLEYNDNDFHARLGNFYTTIGRGLVLRSYDDRDLKLDNNLDGLNVKYDGSIFAFQAMAGSMRDIYDQRGEIIYGLDGEITPGENYFVGAGALFQKLNNGIASLAGIRGGFSGDAFDFYAEAAKIDSAKNPSFYFSFNYYWETISFLLEYKDYDQLAFNNSIGERYNTAPSVTRQHLYSLLNRHPHALDMNDEKGYQFEISWAALDNWTFLLNNSQTFSHHGLKLFEEFYIEAQHDYNSALQLRSALSRSIDKSSATQNITAVADVEYNLDPENLLHFIYQHQHTQNRVDKSEFDIENLQLEYSRSPWLSVALVGEYTNEDQLISRNLERNKWLYASTTVNIGGNRIITLLYGSRQAGYVCVGGVCRYEPEFDGFEAKMLLRF